MNKYPQKWLLVASTVLVFVSIGCSPSKPIYLNETGNLSYYLDRATSVEYPDADIPSLEEVTQAHAPMTVIDPDFVAFEDVTLEDVISMALLNTKIVRGYGTPALQGTNVVPGQDALENAPSAAASSYDVAIRESEPGVINQPGAISSPSALVTNTALDANQGVEAALAEFDANYTGSFSLARSDEPRNGTSILNSEVFTQTQVTWQHEIAKKAANGTQLFFRNINQYTENNNPLVSDGNGGIQILDSFYRASLEAEIRQPLLRGRGAFIQRMPIVISRISTDQQIANLESTLQNMVTNLEVRYWDLYLAYRNFEAAKTGRDAALETYRIVKDQYDEDANVNIQNLAQAEEQYLFFEAQVIDAYNSLLNAEGQLRYLMGWSSTDGRFLRPVDEPTMAPIEFDWCETLCEALTYRPIVRQQRWEIKKRELALQYAKNGLLPEFNLSLVYRWLGLGNKYGVSGDSQTFPDVNSGAINDLLGGDFQEFTFGGSFGAPIGFRREEANVRNSQMKLAREIARGEELELDIARNLAETVRALAANQLLMRKNFGRWVATTREIDHFNLVEELGVGTLDVALDSQRRRAQTEVEFHRAVAEYNKTIALMHLRKGTILAYSGIEFAEGPWPGKAYIDAEEHARRRSASRQINYGWTRPQVISRGENMTPNHNIGHPLTAYPLPVTNDPIPEAGTLQQAPVDGSIAPVPYYEAPMDGTPMLPTLADPDSQSRIESIPTAGVQQVGYQQPVGTATGNQVMRIATSTKGEAQATIAGPTTQPVAVRHPSGVATRQPQRDTNQPPVKRLQAKTPVDHRATRSGASAPAKPATAVSEEASPQQLNRMPWERLGLSRPESGQRQTTARIKSY